MQIAPKLTVSPPHLLDRILLQAPRGGWCLVLTLPEFVAAQKSTEALAILTSARCATGDALKINSSMSDWTFNGAIYAPTPDEMSILVGFIYEIECVSTGKRYIGRKNFYSMRTVKGKCRKQRFESDWQRYWSSQDMLAKAAKANPADYRRTILHLCKTPGAMTFWESSELFKRDAITSADYLNDNIGGKFFRGTVETYIR